MATEITDNPEVLNGKRVLVVDDEESIRSLLGLVFSRSGVEVISAADGEEALQIIQDPATLPIDLVITDNDMPKKKGTELIKEAKIIKPSLPFILMSGGLFGGLNDEDIRKKVEELGANAGISKPFNLKNLVDTARKVLKPKPQVTETV